MASHPDVLEAAAIGVPSDLGEEDVLAVVIPRPGAQFEAADIARWVGSQLAAIKVPKYVVFSDALPKTATHRVEKFKLKADRELLARATVVSADRTSVVTGKSVSVRVDLGGRRIIKKKQHKAHHKDRKRTYTTIQSNSKQR